MTAEPFYKSDKLQKQIYFFVVAQALWLILNFVEGMSHRWAYLLIFMPIIPFNLTLALGYHNWRKDPKDDKLRKDIYNRWLFFLSSVVVGFIIQLFMLLINESNLHDEQGRDMTEEFEKRCKKYNEVIKTDPNLEKKIN